MNGNHKTTDQQLLHADGDSPGKAVEDPLCGTEGNPQNAASSQTHGGETYYFRSTGCADRFRVEPDRWEFRSLRGFFTSSSDSC